MHAGHRSSPSTQFKFVASRHVLISSYLRPKSYRFLHRRHDFQIGSVGRIEDCSFLAEGRLGSWPIETLCRNGNPFSTKMSQNECVSILNACTWSTTTFGIIVFIDPFLLSEREEGFEWGRRGLCLRSETRW